MPLTTEILNLFVKAEMTKEECYYCGGLGLVKIWFKSDVPEKECSLCQGSGWLDWVQQITHYHTIQAYKKDEESVKVTFKKVKT